MGEELTEGGVGVAVGDGGGLVGQAANGAEAVGVEVAGLPVGGFGGGGGDEGAKDREQLLAFYDFTAAHWQHIRTTNPIESVFATVRLRTDKVKNCGSRKTTLAMAWQLMTTAQKRWRKLRGYALLAEVIGGVKFKDGERVENEGQQQAAG